MKKTLFIMLFCISFISATLFSSIEIVEAATIKLNTTCLTLKNVRTYTLKVKNTKKKITWYSSNKKIATVSSKGKVSAKKNGTCYVYAKVSGKKLKCKVIVQSPSILATAIKLNKTSLTLNWGNTYNLKATISPANTTNKKLKWSSSDTHVITVSSSGKITAKNPGNAIITVSTSNNKKTSCKVTVNNQYYINQNTFNRLNATKSSNKIIIVSTKNTSTNYCVVQYFEKDHNLWKQVFKVNGYVGKKGINKTKEGDKKTPTGLFHFTQIMGIAKKPGQTILPYHKIDQNDYWCGEKYYNQFIDEDIYLHNCSKKNDEKLIKYTDAYQYLASFDFNSNNIKGKGSAIFLHCTTNNKYTEGCIAIPNVKMKMLMGKIDKDTIIIIDQSKNIYKY